MAEINPRQLIAGLQRNDPKLWEALNFIIDNIDKVNAELFPELLEIPAEQADILPNAPSQSSFQFAFFPTAIGFSWDYADGALQYEIRVGATWDDGDFVLRTTSLTALIQPIVIGTYHYMLKSVSVSGDYSEGLSELTIIVDGPSGVSPSASVIDNNVLIDWNDAESEFQIDHYIITKNGAEIGTIKGTFTTTFESLAGTYTYGVIPVDIVGNQGPHNTITAIVNQPPDFALQSEMFSNWAGTKVNCFAFD